MTIDRVLQHLTVDGQLRNGLPACLNHSHSHLVFLSRNMILDMSLSWNVRVQRPQSTRKPPFAHAPLRHKWACAEQGTPLRSLGAQSRVEDFSVT